MKRYPDGSQGKHFFQKDAPSHMPAWIPRAPSPASTREGVKRTIDYPLVNDKLALLWMVNMGCIDLNAWASRADRPDRPDWVMFDLDPSDDVGFPEVIEVALLVRQMLDLVGLEKVPQDERLAGDPFSSLSPVGMASPRYAHRRIVAGALARAHPGLVTTEWTKRKRGGVLVDASQNGPGRRRPRSTPYAPGPARPSRRRSRWDEVRPGLDPSAFTFDEVRRRVAREGDLFAPVLASRQSLGAALRSSADRRRAAPGQARALVSAAGSRRSERRRSPPPSPSRQRT